MSQEEFFMQRCFDLAILGAGQVAPNPMVGAVLVHNDRVIGEGFHQKYGHAHAEVNAVASVKTEDRHLIPVSTLFVSLEPCCTFGKTPPCTDLILREKIPEVVLSFIDFTPAVAGKSIRLLEKAGVKVKTQVLKSRGFDVSLVRNLFVRKNRPFIILKYAQSANHFFAPLGKQLWLSNAYSKRLTHKWRAEADAILVGTNTAQIDNPSLTTRLFPGSNPLRIVIDKKGALNPDLAIFDGSAPTLVLTEPGVQLAKPLLQLESPADNMMETLFQYLFEQGKSSLLVEGGAQLINSLIAKDYWDEARIYTSSKIITKGLPAPVLAVPPLQHFQIATDQLTIFRRPNLMD